jgi:glucuronate isomerase
LLPQLASTIKKKSEKLLKSCQKVVKSWRPKKVVKKLSQSCQKSVKKLSKSCQKVVKKFQKVVDIFATPGNYTKKTGAMVQ